jgi:hypothetical protein
MYINPIHAGAVAQACALAVAARVPTPAVAPRRPRFQPLQWLVGWLLQPDKADARTADAAQLMQWSECAGRNYVTALGGVLVMKMLQEQNAPPRTPPGA